MTQFTTAKLNVRGFRQHTAAATVEKFTTRTADDKVLWLLVKDDGTFVLVSCLTVIGWTADAAQAFQFFNNAGVWDFSELMEGANHAA